MNKARPAGKILHFLTSQGMGYIRSQCIFLIPRKAPQRSFLQPLDYRADHWSWV